MGVGALSSDRLPATPGDDPLSLASEELPLNVRIVRGRPNLPSVIPNIIYSIETGEGLPEVGWQEQQLKKDLANLALKMNVTADTPAEQMKQLRGIARERGYSLAEFCRPQASAHNSRFSSKVREWHLLVEQMNDDAPLWQTPHLLDNIVSRCRIPKLLKAGKIMLCLCSI